MCAHAGASATSQGVGELEALKAVAALGLLPHHVQDAVHQLCTFCVVTLGPVVARTRLTEDKVVGPEDGSIGPGPDTVHGAGLQIDEDGAGHKLSASGHYTEGAELVDSVLDVVM